MITTLKVDAKLYVVYVYRWVYRHECVLQSVEGALLTLQVAIQYLCPELADLCVQYISSNITPANVLRVFQEIYR